MINAEKKFVPVMITPYDEAGNIDFDGLTNLTEYYIAAGARGLFANCLSSEMYMLTPAERIAITKHVVRIANGRVPVVATGSFDRDISQMSEFIKTIYDTGIKSVILSSCMLADESEGDDVFQQRFETILNKTDDITFGFYECPVPYKRVVSADLLKHLLSSNRVSYFKDTSLDINLVREKLKVGASYNFGLFDAYMVHAVESLSAGSAGLSCIQGNYFPELIVWLCANYDNPDLREKVENVQAFFRDHMDIMHRFYPTTAKEVLRQRGLNISSFSRIQANPMTAEDRNKLANLLAAYYKLEEELMLCAVV
ncbi:dihydrodipicolinate synthase family protein [Danxiaibacter flavus]|uniref:Dihydrodipicolinate synthase family protein n=1 Tax=Danxiaibacter flavus TaxID=3049108 RepID=A0ABV3ZNY3_9BACT|nr:dihydrodipicolinate synthase family protein [Chitinophagaceae bacterium DXS]